MSIIEQDREHGLEISTSGDPMDVAIRGMKKLAMRKRGDALADAVGDRFGANISTQTATVMRKMAYSHDGAKLIESLLTLGYDMETDYESEISSNDINTFDDMLNFLDRRMDASLARRNVGANSVSRKGNRITTYVSDVITRAGEEGDVYMAKSLTSDKKVRLAWALNENNVIVVVDEYTEYEDVLGWKKLKELPHGSKKIQKLYGDRLSESEIQDVIGSSNSSSKPKKPNPSRNTSRQPHKKTLIVSRGTRSRKKSHMVAENILKMFRTMGQAGNFPPIDTLVLFPTTTDKNMTDYWHLTSTSDDDTTVALANCNKSTYEYLNQSSHVYHIDDYLEASMNYEIETSRGTITMDDDDLSNVVFHTVHSDVKDRLMEPSIRSKVMDVIASDTIEQISRGRYRGDERIPDRDEMIYAPIDKVDMHHVEPAMVELEKENRDDFISIKGDVGLKHFVTDRYFTSDYILYTHARLHNWSEETTAIQALLNVNVTLSAGGFELIETMAQAHDMGLSPYEVPDAS